MLSHEKIIGLLLSLLLMLLLINGDQLADALPTAKNSALRACNNIFDLRSFTLDKCSKCPTRTALATDEEGITSRLVSISELR